jgi:transcription antitermination factor NusG
MSAPSHFWAVAVTVTRREGYAADQLERAGFDSFLPKIKIRAENGNWRVEPLFPGYLFVRIVERWYSIAWTNGVTRLIMAGDQPARCPDQEIDKIQHAIGGNGLVRLPPANRPAKCLEGQPVRILTGSFRGLTAIYVGMSARARETVLLDLLGQKQVRVELAEDDRITPALASPQNSVY